MTRKNWIAIFFAAAAAFSCGGENRADGTNGGDSCDPQTQGFVTCGSGITETCQPG